MNCQGTLISAANGIPARNSVQAYSFISWVWVKNSCPTMWWLNRHEQNDWIFYPMTGHKAYLSHKIVMLATKEHTLDTLILILLSLSAVGWQTRSFQTVGSGLSLTAISALSQQRRNKGSHPMFLGGKCGGEQWQKARLVSYPWHKTGVSQN